MALIKIRTLNNIPGDPAIQRAFNAVSTAMSQTVDTLAAAFNLTSALVTVKTALSVTGGITAGSRTFALRGVVGQNNLVTDGSYGAGVYASGSTPGFTPTYFVAPWAGSIAGVSAKVYNAVATAGTLEITTRGATKNIDTGAVNFINFNTPNYVKTFTPGAYPFAAGDSISLQVISVGWVQGAGATGVECTLFVYM